jgi:hypothetical protein
VNDAPTPNQSYQSGILTSRTIRISAIILTTCLILSSSLFVIFHNFPAKIRGVTTTTSSIATVGTISPSSTPPSSLPTAGTGPTATPISISHDPGTPASSATVTFDSVSDRIFNVGAATASVNGGADISAYQATIRLIAGTKDSTFTSNEASMQPGTQVTTTLTVHNPTSQNQPYGGPVYSVTGISCTPYGSSVLWPGGTFSVTCVEPAQHEPATTYDYTDSNGLIWTGNAPAGGISGYFYVPSTCVTDQGTYQTHENAKSTLDYNFAVQYSGSAAFYTTYSYNDSSAACYPSPGYQQATEFRWGVSENASLTESYVLLSDIQNYDTHQLNAQISANWYASGTFICKQVDYIFVTNPQTSTTKTTVSCPSGETLHYKWDQQARFQLATQLAGYSVAHATAILYTLSGVAPQSSGAPIIITLNGGNILPTDPTKITINVIE